MNIKEFTEIYTKNFVKAKRSTLTRRTYQKLLDIGQAQGVNLSRKFFLSLCNGYVREPDKFEDLNEKEIQQKILIQMQSYINQFDGIEMPERKKERGMKVDLER